MTAILPLPLAAIDFSVAIAEKSLVKFTDGVTGGADEDVDEDVGELEGVLDELLLEPPHADAAKPTGGQHGHECDLLGKQGIPLWDRWTRPVGRVWVNPSDRSAEWSNNRSERA